MCLPLPVQRRPTVLHAPAQVWSTFPRPNVASGGGPKPSSSSFRDYCDGDYARWWWLAVAAAAVVVAVVQAETDVTTTQTAALRCRFAVASVWPQQATPVRSRARTHRHPSDSNTGRVATERASESFFIYLLIDGIRFRTFVLALLRQAYRHRPPRRLLPHAAERARYCCDGVSSESYPLWNGTLDGSFLHRPFSFRTLNAAPSAGRRHACTHAPTHPPTNGKRTRAGTRDSGSQSMRPCIFSVNNTRSS